MKICVINNLYPPYNRGGAEIVAENQVKQLVLQGHQVFVVTTRPFTRFLPPNIKKLEEITCLFIVFIRGIFFQYIS